MSDPYAPPPGQPDPYRAPSDPYAQPGSPQSVPPSYGAPGQQPYGQPAYGQQPYGQPGYAQQPPAKSKKGLIIGIVVGAVVLLLILCGIGVALIANAADDDDPIVPTTPTRGATPGNSAAAPPPGNNNAITADSSSDFGDVCQGGSILNAAEYTTPASAKAYVFANTPTRKTSWSYKSLDSRASYYAKSSDYAQVSVVGCLAYVEGSEAAGQKCDIKTSDGTKLTLDYMSSRYTLTFHNARTGEKIGDGGTVNAPANRCPSFLTYNKETLKSYASPDTASIDAALKKQLS
ncbi:flagellar basal body-associated FliL family protein [Catellatospora vulcania]|uniref:hypothetical protein n=1 Tax=Catellatospora vulcania TaxID=1460450 RepID=UPI0012D41C61|nr:hypothetical protein [Catellatospora vulcania]